MEWIKEREHQTNREIESDFQNQREREVGEEEEEGGLHIQTERAGGGKK